MSESRIVADHHIMGGVPCIRGTRVPVATVIGLFAQGHSFDELLADYSQLSVDDVHAGLRVPCQCGQRAAGSVRTPA